MTTTEMMMADLELEEILRRIDIAHADFLRLIRAADLTAPVLDGTWTVRETLAHVVSVSKRYVSIATTGTYQRAETPRDVDALNDTELRAFAGATAEDLRSELTEDLVVIKDLLRTWNAAGTETLFHGGAYVDSLTGATNWLGELRIHGSDIAQAVRQPWDLPERDMLMIFTGGQRIAPGYLHVDRAAGVDLMVEMRVRGARRWIMHVHDGACESRPWHPGDRPHSIFAAPATAMTLMFYQRIGVLGGARRGALIVGGSRPWRGAGLVRLFEKP